ncbi:unnamed protein product [Schistosoma curassoni]|uniref:Ras-GEF domain-containing protein n=1 Tax=Schistosoma curassoni TaxID=6186 RepID=A0A183K8Z9_9TREM|nr:unnamed protein product [Schistosoma curassoni]
MRTQLDTSPSTLESKHVGCASAAQLYTMMQNMFSAITDLSTNVELLLEKFSEREHPHQFDCGLSSQQFPSSSEVELQTLDTGLQQKETRNRFVRSSILKLYTFSGLTSNEHLISKKTELKTIMDNLETQLKPAYLDHEPPYVLLDSLTDKSITESKCKNDKSLQMTKTVRWAHPISQSRMLTVLAAG